MKFSQFLCALIVMATITSPTESRAAEIQFVEDFVLAEDRAKAIEQLIPGTDEYYFFQCLYLQNQQKFNEVNKLLQRWQQRHGSTDSYREIEHRQMLLTYADNPKRSLDFIINQLHPNLDHQRDQLESKPKLPGKVDPSKISFDAFKRAALRRHRNSLKGFADLALDELGAADLNPARRRELLGRLSRPTHPELVELVLADLQHQGSRGFGSLSIHNNLLLEQLDDLGQRRPQLVNEATFVNAYIQKLQPNPDIDWKNDPQESEAYFSRLWTFVGELNASHNSLKAHVLFNWLTFDESQGRHNKQRFLQYLSLPRRMHYVEPRMLELADARRYPVDLGLNPGAVTKCPPIQNDEPLVRRYLLHFFQSAGSTKDYEPYVADEYLRHVFAEAKITAGLGNPEKWYSLLPPAKYQALKDRVDLDFAPTNPKVFRSDDLIQLDIDVKNVDKLLVKVYEVNTANYYQQHQREVNTDIKLDGLIANHEVTYEYDDAAVVRKRRHFEFPDLQQPGVYVIDFIGNGKSSRAVVRKGQLQYLVETNIDGHRFSVFNDKLEQLKDVSLWMSGQYYTTDADGGISVPFSTKPGRQPIVLTYQNLSSLHFFQHAGERYKLNVAAYIDRESLLNRQEAVVLLRPQLVLGGVPVSTHVMENVSVTIQSTSIGGVKAEKRYDDVKLLENSDTPLLFLVPNQLASIEVSLSAVITDARKRPVTVTANHQVTVNQIDTTDRIDDLHLTQMDDVYMLQLLGKTGESIPHRPVRVRLRHRHFSDWAQFDLATDDAGMVQLGQLSDITQIAVSSRGAADKNWNLLGDRRTYSRSIHGFAGQTIRVPHMKGKDGLAESKVSLYELRGGMFAIDRTGSVKVTDHYVELVELSAGDYSLDFDGQTHQIRITAGDKMAGFAVGGMRRLELRRLQPIQLTSVTADKENLRIKVDNASKFTRVHVYATRFYPAFDVFQSLSAVREAEPLTMRVPAYRSYYMAGRTLGEELQYVLERAYLKKFPGNMLDRPTVLLNSWPIRSTETTTQTAADGEEFQSAADAPASMMNRAKQQKAANGGLADFANLDFLAEPTMVISNQRPDKNGVLTIPLEDLGPHHHFHVVAVDPLTTVYRSLAMSATRTPQRDLRLKQGLDPEKHYTQQQVVTVLPKGEKFELADFATGRFDSYDSLKQVYSLYSTLSGNDTLKKFQFVIDWPTLSSDEKQDKYSEFACHELNFFIYKKDPQFFAEVVRPYIENKHHKTFLDLWLLEFDVTHYLKPWEYTLLNTAERLLLADRIDGEDERVRRFVRDRFDITPRNVNQENVWFETAIAGKALNSSDKFGFLDKKVRFQDAMTRVPMAASAEDSGVASGGVVMESLANDFQAPGLGGGGRAESLARRKSGRNLSRNFANSAQGIVVEEKARAAKQRRLSETFGVDGLAELDEMDADNNFYSKSRGRDSQQLYEKLEMTKEWAENNYYHLPIENHNEDLILVNAFWKDFAERKKDQPFFSIHWPAATGNFSEMMFALSLLDLPFEAAEHATEFNDRRMILTAASPMVVFHEQIREAPASDGASPILTTQNFFRADDRYQMVQGERRDKFVNDEFLTHVVYGCQVVLTNPTTTQRRVQLLLQIPAESIPTNGGKSTRTVDVDLPPYHTQTVEYFFYFPEAGNFPHFPVHVAREEKLLAFAAAKTLKVVDKPSNVNTESWDYISQFASEEQVLEFLRTSNVLELDLERIAFRLKKKAFFQQVISLLEARHVFEPTLWAYGLQHNDVDTIATYLKHNNAFIANCGEAIESDLVAVDPISRRTYQHLDYKPLVNARAHRLGGRRRILNNRFDEQYHRLLEVLKYRRDLRNEDRMAMTYYLLLQDRIEEAIEMFKSVEQSNVESRIQYDYFAAYLDCFEDEPTKARSIVTRYANYPVPKWKNAFANMKNMLDEVDGNNVLVVDPKDRTQTQTAAAAEQSNFDFVVEDKQVRVDYQNVESLRVNYYLIDLELLFSSNPFVQQFSGQFSHIKPNKTDDVGLPINAAKHAFDLPQEFHNRNVLVEVVANGITRSQAYFSNSLSLQLSENYGQLKVSDTITGKPLPKTYVKVYAEMQDGQTRFYKDGYTDLRGRFDYASLSTNEQDFVKRFSLLVLDDRRGGLVKEARVPKR